MKLTDNDFKNFEHIYTDWSSIKDSSEKERRIEALPRS